MAEAHSEDLIRCPWCLGDDDYTHYHDKEWGRPLKNNRKLFELLVLEGAQAGLSWLTILKRRNGYREVFDGMDPEKIARYGDKDIERCMGDARIIRNRRKIQSAIENSKVFLEMMEGPVSFSKWLWNWVDGEPIIHHYKTMKEVPATTELSDRIAKEMKKKGFSFVGSTIVYAYMQSAGLVNDHLVDCFRRQS
ncbi:DNA-3-methyladenine glycosylase I [Treponema primitia]|nr:DNA-3-methyladenine glycosylase I [Treponema primitia]